MERDVIIALDFATTEETVAFLDKFTEEKPFVKIGMEDFYGNGPELVREVKKRGHKIFLDLKLHDIPNTVKSAMRGLAKLGVDLVNVHAAGGRPMMEAALEGLTREDSGDTLALMGIIVNLKDYTIGADKGGAVNMFDDFDIDYNAMKYLIETRCSGALIKPYSAIAVEMKTTQPAG